MSVPPCYEVNKNTFWGVKCNVSAVKLIFPRVKHNALRVQSRRASCGRAVSWLGSFGLNFAQRCDLQIFGPAVGLFQKLPGLRALGKGGFLGGPGLTRWEPFRQVFGCSLNKHSYWKLPCIVDLPPIIKMVIFYSYVSLPGGSFPIHHISLREIPWFVLMLFVPLMVRESYCKPFWLSMIPILLQAQHDVDLHHCLDHGRGHSKSGLWWSSPLEKAVLNLAGKLSQVDSVHWPFMYLYLLYLKWMYVNIVIYKDLTVTSLQMILTGLSHVGNYPNAGRTFRVDCNFPV